MASVSTTTASDAESIPSATPAKTSTDNASENNPSTPAPSTSSSSVKRTVVTVKRKEELLLQARAERKQWIRSIPLPFDPELLSSKNQKANSDATYHLWSSRDGLDSFQSSLVFNDRLLHGATTVLSELYGIGSALDDDDTCEEKDGESDGNAREESKNLPNRPLSIDNVADRVGRLTKPFLDTEGQLSSQPETSIGRNNEAQGTDQKETLDEKYKDMRTAYEEFAEALLLPESAVTVQGMKNFVRNFETTAGTKKKDEDDDKMVQNMASVVNGQIRSSYESLPTKNNSTNSNNTSSDAQGQGHPDWDRRSLESFVYGQVKTVVDATLDRIIGNTSEPPSPDSPFPMTQTAFDTRLEELQFLQPSHLELACLKDDDNSSTPETNLATLLKGPINALRSIESFFSPYEKLCKVLEVYHGVNTVLKDASKSLPMADDVISAMILVIVKASASQAKSSLKNLLRDLHFVENFAIQDYKRLGSGEAEYAFTSLYGAVYFLQGVELDCNREETGGGNKATGNRLAISNDDLRMGLEKSRAVAAKRNAKLGVAVDGGDDDSKPAGLISRGVDLLLGESDPSNGKASAPSFVPNPRQLSVREVRAARLRGETLNLEWALTKQVEPPVVEDVSKAVEYSSPAKSPSKSVFQPQRYTFLGVRPENIKLSDLPRLLDEYRKLILANEQLLGEHQRANNKIQMEKKRIRDEKHRRTLGEQALLFGDAIAS